MKITQKEYNVFKFHTNWFVNIVSHSFITAPFVSNFLEIYHKYTGELVRETIVRLFTFIF